MLGVSWNDVKKTWRLVHNDKKTSSVNFDKVIHEMITRIASKLTYEKLEFSVVSHIIYKNNKIVLLDLVDTN